MGTTLPSPKFSAHVHCGQTAGWMKPLIGMEVSLSPGDFVLDETQFSSPKGDGAPYPIFGPFLLRPNGWMHQDATWYGCRPQPSGLCARWKPSPPSQKGGVAPKFLVHVYCGHTAGWIKIPLGTKVGLSPGNSVRWGPIPPQRPFGHNRHGP